MPDLNMPMPTKGSATRYSNKSFMPVLGPSKSASLPALAPCHSSPDFRLHSSLQSEARATHEALGRMAYKLAERVNEEGDVEYLLSSPSTPSTSHHSPHARTRTKDATQGLSPIPMRMPIKVMNGGVPTGPLPSRESTPSSPWFTSGSPRSAWAEPRALSTPPFTKAESLEAPLVASLRARIDQLQAKLAADTRAFRAERRSVRVSVEQAHRKRVTSEIARAKAAAEVEPLHQALSDAHALIDQERKQTRRVQAELMTALEESRAETARVQQTVGDHAKEIRLLSAQLAAMKEASEVMRADLERAHDAQAAAASTAANAGGGAADDVRVETSEEIIRRMHRDEEAQAEEVAEVVAEEEEVEHEEAAEVSEESWSDRPQHSEPDARPIRLSPYRRLSRISEEKTFASYHVGIDLVVGDDGRVSLATCEDLIDDEPMGDGLPSLTRSYPKHRTVDFMVNDMGGVSVVVGGR